MRLFLSTTPFQRRHTIPFRCPSSGLINKPPNSACAVTTHAFDALGRETAATGEGPASNIVYSATGNVISKTDADGVKTESVFDASGRTTREVVVAAGGKTRTTTTAYDETGKVLVTTDPDGKRIDNEYDVLGRMTKEIHTTDLGPVKREARSFDSLGRVETTTDEIAGVTRAFSYANGTPGATTLRTSYAGVVTTTTVGTDGRESSRVSDLLGVSLTRSSGASDTAGRETGWSVGNTSYSRTFNGAGQLTDWSAGSIASGSLSYDAAARKNRDQMSSALLASIEQTYTYTDEGRLASVKPSGVATTTYAFDPAGNLTTETASASTVMSHDTKTTQRLINRKVGGSVVATYTFDAFGQRIAQGSVSNPTSETFGYTGTGRLASYTTSSGVSATYLYDASGQRTQSVVSQGSVTTTTTYTYEGLSLLSLAAERSDGATWSVSYLYDADGLPYAGVYASGATTPAVFHMVATDRGDVVQLLDVSGDAFAAYRYDVWGLPTASATTTTSVIASETIVAEIASRQPLRYAGYAFDEHSGLYYLSARSYDPETRQFLSKDPAKDDGEESAYQYCRGNPIGLVDPSGLSWVRSAHLTGACPRGQGMRGSGPGYGAADIAAGLRYWFGHRTYRVRRYTNKAQRSARNVKLDKRRKRRS